MHEPSSIPVSPDAFPAARTTPDARHAFGGVWRLTVSRFFKPKYWLSLAGLLALLALAAVPLTSSRATAANDYLPWVAGFYLTFVLPILAFLVAGGAMREEYRGATVDYVLTRPVYRPAYLVFKYISHLACAQLDFLAAFLVLLGLGVGRGVPGMWDAAPRLLLAQAVLLTVFSALGFLAAVLTARYVAVGLVYGGIIEVGVGRIPTQLSRLSMTQQVRAMLAPVTRPGLEVLATDASVFGTTVALLVVAAGAVALAAALFGWQEFSGGGSRDA